MQHGRKALSDVVGLTRVVSQIEKTVGFPRDTRTDFLTFGVAAVDGSGRPSLPVGHFVDV